MGHPVGKNGASSAWATLRWSARLGAALVFALAGVPAHGQSWNLYGNGSQFFVPITLVPKSSPDSGPPTYTVSLTLNGNNTNPFILDTGSLGLVASSAYYTPEGKPLANYATITYSTSGSNPVGALYMTEVRINGENGKYVAARVPILAATQNKPDSFHQLGIGFDRGGVMIGPDSNPATLTAANNSYNMNPFLALTGSSRDSGVNVGTMQPGYIIGVNGFDYLGLGNKPGILLGLNSQNTSGFAFQQLASAGGLPSYCSTPGMGCPLSWSSQNASITIKTDGRTYELGTASVLPDSGISYMIVNSPGNDVPTERSLACTAGDKKVDCLKPGSTVEVYLPGQTQAAYSFKVDEFGNPSTPYGVEVTKNDPPPSNLGRTFFENITYVYDPINGFVGYRATNKDGTNAIVVPMLALQGNLTLPNGFLSSFTTFLMSGLTVNQTGSGTLGGPIIGPGGLTLQSGNLTLGGANSYGGGTVVNGGMLTLGASGSLLGNVTVNGGGFTNNGTLGGNGLLTINAGSFVNNGTVNTPSQWQVNQGSFTNNGTFNGSLANTGTATNGGMLAGSVINTATGTFSNTGTITGSVSNLGSFTNNGMISGSFGNSGMLSGTGTIGGSLANSGLLAPGNSIGTMTVSGSYVHGSGAVFATEVGGAGLGDRLNVGGTANLQGGIVTVTTLPGMAFAPSTTYTLVNAAGGLTGTFASVNELYPFLLSNLSYDANNAYLNLAIGGFAAAGATPTQIAVGNVLDANVNNATGDFATVLGAMAFNTTSNAQAQATLQAISGNNYAGFSTSMVQGMQLFMNNFANQTGGGGSPMSNRVALAEACDVACDTTNPPKWGAWGGALGGLGTVGAGQPVGTVTYNAGGFAAGLDRLVTDTFRMGVTAGYSTGTQWVGGFDGLGRSNTFQVGLYGGFAQDRLYADGLIGYAYTQNQMWRNIPIPGLQPRTAYGNTGANQWYGQLETGYRFDIGTNANAFVTPFARLQAYTANQNAFTETGAQSLNLSIAQQQTNSLRSVIGAQLGGSMDLGWREKLFAQLRLGWSHEYADVGRPV
ncbi:MAG: autotransporter domain-containing protein, partial [Reyranella sp.]|nr:autotransporter domain-containing protein [Reyranella sp.]